MHCNFIVFSIYLSWGRNEKKDGGSKKLRCSEILGELKGIELLLNSIILFYSLNLFV